MRNMADVGGVEVVLAAAEFGQAHPERAVQPTHEVERVGCAVRRIAEYAAFVLKKPRRSSLRPRKFGTRHGVRSHKARPHWMRPNGRQKRLFGRANIEYNLLIINNLQNILRKLWECVDGCSQDDDTALPHRLFEIADAVHEAHLEGRLAVRGVVIYSPNVFRKSAAPQSEGERTADVSESDDGDIHNERRLRASCNTFSGLHKEMRR